MSEKMELMAVDFLLNASKRTIEDAMLNRCADSANRRKQILEMMDSWAERQAEQMLLTWFLDHGSELAATITLPPLVTESKPVLRVRTGPLSAEEFREVLQSLVDS